MTRSHIEEWRHCPLVPDYDVSSKGRVRRKEWWKRMPKGGMRRYGGKPWYGSHRKNWMGITYLGKNYRVHRMVASAFLPDPPSDRSLIMHIDEDYTNNRPENLAWGTNKENSNAPKFIEYCKKRRKVDGGWHAHVPPPGHTVLG